MVMNKKELAPGIMLYSDIIPEYKSLPDDIEEGIIGAHLQWNQSQIKGQNGVEIDKSSRDTMTIVIPYRDSVSEDFQDFQDAFYTSVSNIFLPCFSEAELDYKRTYSFETTWHDSYSILKYGEGQKFVNHIDDHKDFHRRLSLVYYINDNYTGGEIVFPRFDIKYKPNANELLLFPSTYVYNHSVLPVLEGTRYSVASWLR
jgi:hypothetical protein